jgi:hypothetical protein
MIPNAGITVQFPVDYYHKVDSMRLFKGFPSHANIDWKPTDNLDMDKTVIEEGGAPDDTIYYILQSLDLGWINCDRFTDITEKTDISFTSPPNFGGSVNLIFTNIKSIMPGTLLEKQYDNILFENIPQGERATMLLYQLSKDKSIVSYTTSEIIIGETTKPIMNQGTITLGEFKALVNSLSR